MKVKVAGPITAERLTEALEQATARHREAMGQRFDGFYGATLYLNAYSNEGEQVAVMQGDKEVSLILRLPAGVQMRPMLSERAVQARDQRLAEQARTREVLHQMEVENERRFEAEKARRRALQAEQHQHERVFARIHAAFGEALIAQCNAAIETVWAQWQPKEPHGPRKDQLRDRPFLAVEDGRVMLYVGVGRSARSILTPLSKLASHGTELEPFWKHDVWVQGVVPALRAVIDGFLRQLPAEVAPAA